MKSGPRIIEANLELTLSEKPWVTAVDGHTFELLGFNANDFLSGHINFLGLIHPDDTDVAELLCSPVPELQFNSCNIRMRHADGRVRSIQASFRKEHRAGAIHLTLLLQDATTISTTLDEQSQSPIFRALFESTEDFILFKDRNHVYTAASRNFQTLLSPTLRGANLPGLTDYDFLTEQEADSFYASEKKVLNGVATAHDVLRVRRPDGVNGWIDTHHFPLKNEEGAIVGMFLIARDITEQMQSESALREAKDRLQQFVEHAPAALAMFDREMRFLRASQRWMSLFNLAGRDIVGQSHYAVFPDLPERWIQAHRRGLAGECVRCEEDRFVTDDGSARWSRWEILPWRLDDGSVGGIIIFVEDITRFKEAEQRLELAASVFKHASEGIMVTDLDGTILEVNEAFIRLTGYTRDEALGSNPRILSSGLQSPEFYQEMWRTIREFGRWRGEFWNRTKGGQLFAVTSTIMAVCDAAGKRQHYVGLFVDITPIKEQERKLEHVAHYDALTGLPNRVMLAENLSHAMALTRKAGQMLAVVYFDLDGFKTINDLHGRDAADALLLAVASGMKQVLREGDTLGRIGGDEFVAVLPGLAGVSAAVPVLTRLLDATAQPYQYGDRVFAVTASCGATFYPQTEDVDADQLLRQADRAMYEAKQSGKNRYHLFDPGRDSSVRGRLEQTDRMRRALGDLELLLFYQPVVNMATGELISVEALLRWQHPQRGLLPPGLFLPAIEDHDLIIEVGDWVIVSALDQIAAWAALGLDVTVSVNVSARQLDQPDFVDRLRVLLAKHPHVDPSSLELEVLETSALRDVARVSAFIAACREIGMSVAIDDFGTGYSSLTYLKRLPASILKIDQSFIRDMLDDPDDLAILQGVLGLATAFRRTTIAEGVETVDHGVLLLQLGCRLGQGYGIARPMPAAQLPEWIARWRPDPRWVAAQPLSPLQWPLLIAETEIRTWNTAFEQFMKGERATAPELDERQCRFGGWIDAERRGAHAASAGFHTIEALHARAHIAAKQAAASKTKGQIAKAAALLTETIGLRLQILDHLKSIFTTAT